jgi:hypothetical protein
MSILDEDVFFAELRSEVEVADVHPKRIVVRPSPTNEDIGQLVLVNGTQERDVLSLIDELRRP